MKTCNRCFKMWPLDQFAKNAATKDRLARNCKQCAKGASRAYYERNKGD